jgi:hypothetical protein
MPEVRRVGDLEIDQDLRFQRREWAFERVAWVGMALLVLAALLGLLGRGPMSRQTAASPDGAVTVEYERFLNHRAATTVTVRVSGEVTVGGTFRLAINQDYLRGVQIDQITPTPDHTEAGEDRHLFVFRAADPGRPTAVVFHLEPEGPASLHGAVSVPGGPPAAFDQVVYP